MKNLYNNNKTNAGNGIFKAGLICLLLACNTAFAQQKFGDNLGNHTATQDVLLDTHQLLNASGISIGTAVFSSASVALEISATNKALLISRLATNADMLTLTAVDGMMVYVTGDSKFYLHQGNAWEPVSTGPSVSAGEPNTTSTANGFTLSALGVLALSPADETNPGIVTTGTQTLAGDKTLSGVTTVSNTTASASATTGALVVTGGAGITGDVNLASNFVASGGTGAIPVTGAGTRMMWYPKKAAFRAGIVNTEWDDVNIGVNSVAFGRNVTASGEISTAFGVGTIASGFNSIASGSATIASGNYSAAFGNKSIASGFSSIGFGTNTTASGGQSIALGSNVSTNSLNGSVIIGDGQVLPPGTQTLSTGADQMTTRFLGGYRFLVDGTATKGVTIANTGLATYIKDYSATAYAAISDANTLVPKGYVDSKALTLAAPTTASAANAATVTDGVLALSPADATNPGIVTTGAQTIGGAKTFDGNISGNATATSTISNFSAVLVAQNAAYTLTLADNGKIMTVNSATAVTVTVPTLAAGFNCMIVQTGAGQVTIAGSGTTISNRQNYTKTAGQNAIATIIALTSNTFISSGDML